MHGRFRNAHSAVVGTWALVFSVLTLGCRTEEQPVDGGATGGAPAGGGAQGAPGGADGVRGIGGGDSVSPTAPHDHRQRE